MSDDFDMHRLNDIGDPLSGAAEMPIGPLRSRPTVRPRTRSQVALVRGAALCMSVLYELAWLAILAKRGDLATMSRTTLLVEVLVPMAAAVLAFAVAVAPGSNGMGIPKRRLAVLTLLAPLLFVLGTAIAGPADADTRPFIGHVLGCLGWTMLFSTVPLALAAWAFRGVFVAAPGWRLAALGVSCAGLAAATMSVACSVGSPAHVILGHGGMMLVAGIGGAIFGRKIGQA
jgi:hypothetical protein